MTVYVFDGTMDGLLTAVFEAYSLKEQPEELLKGGNALPLFCERTYQVTRHRGCGQDWRNGWSARH